MEKVFLGILAGATDPRVVQAARGVLDFIYYAHFETHTDESLAQLDATWLMFHENKEVFEELEIRQHFNISKLHNIKHYIDSIQSQGAANGFNTENTERLHIDLTKMGYNASNKRDYINQMTTWLRHQESIDHFAQYLQWVVPGYIVEVMGEEEGQEVDAEEEDDIEEEQDNQCASFTIAKKPAIVGADAKSVTNDYGTVDFLYYLDNFIHTSIPSCPAALTENTDFSLYKCVVLQLPPIPEVSSQPICDVVLAVKGSPQRLTVKGIKKTVPGQFSTVLVHVRGSEGGNDGPLKGM